MFFVTMQICFFATFACEAVDDARFICTLALAFSCRFQLRPVVVPLGFFCYKKLGNMSF